MKIPTLPTLPLTILTLLTLFSLISLQTRPIPMKPTQPELIIRPGYTSYDAYITHQLKKTLNPKLRHIWATKDWARKTHFFTAHFQALQAQNLLSNTSKALSIGARMGQEVAALIKLGVSDSLGIDLVPSPPLVIKGDFHAQPFDDETFDFEFSNVFDHALFPEKFVGEIERTLKKGGVCVLHVSISRRTDKYSANDLLSVDGLIRLFKKCEVIRVGKIDAFGLDTEVIFRKNFLALKSYDKKKLFYVSSWIR